MCYCIYTQYFNVLRENKTAQEAQKKVKTGEKNYWKKLLGITKDM